MRQKNVIQDSSSSPDLSDLGFKPVTTPPPTSGGVDLSDLGFQPVATATATPTPEPSRTPATDQAVQSSQGLFNYLFRRQDPTVELLRKHAWPSAAGGSIPAGEVTPQNIMEVSGRPIGGPLPRYNPQPGDPWWKSTLGGYYNAGAGLSDFATSPRGLAELGVTALFPPAGLAFLGAELTPGLPQQIPQIYKAATGQLSPAESAEAGMGLALVTAPLAHPIAKRIAPGPTNAPLPQAVPSIWNLGATGIRQIPPPPVPGPFTPADFARPITSTSTTVSVAPPVEPAVTIKPPIQKPPVQAAPEAAPAWERPKPIEVQERRDLEGRAQDVVDAIEDPLHRKQAQDRLDKIKGFHQDLRQEHKDATTDGERIRAEMEMVEYENDLRKMAGETEVVDRPPITAEDIRKDQEWQARRVVEIQGKLDRGESITKQDRGDWRIAGQDPEKLPKEEVTPPGEKAVTPVTQPHTASYNPENRTVTIRDPAGDIVAQREAPEGATKSQINDTAQQIMPTGVRIQWEGAESPVKATETAPELPKPPEPHAAEASEILFPTNDLNFRGGVATKFSDVVGVKKTTNDQGKTVYAIRYGPKGEYIGYSESDIWELHPNYGKGFGQPQPVKATPEQISGFERRIEEAQNEMEVLKGVKGMPPERIQERVDEIDHLKKIIAGEIPPDALPEAPASSRAGAIKRAEEMYAATGGYGKGSPLGETAPVEAPPPPAAAPAVEVPVRQGEFALPGYTAVKTEQQPAPATARPVLSAEQLRLREAQQALQNYRDQNPGRPDSVLLKKQVTDAQRALDEAQKEPGKIDVPENAARLNRIKDLQQELNNPPNGIPWSRQLGNKEATQRYAELLEELWVQHDAMHQALRDEPAEVLVIGTGAGGSSAAKDLAYEGVRVRALEKTSTIGGASKNSQEIINAARKATAQRGKDLWWDEYEAMRSNGVEIKTSTYATGEPVWDEATGLWSVPTNKGIEKAHYVISAPGQRSKIYPEFNYVVGGEIHTEWGGLSYGHADRMYREGAGGDIIVLGGGNDALQSVMGAIVRPEINHVTVLARSPLEKSGSFSPEERLQWLAIKDHPKVTIIEGKLEGTAKEILRDHKGMVQGVLTKAGQRINAKAVGVFLQKIPNTEWMPTSWKAKMKPRHYTELAAQEPAPKPSLISTDPQHRVTAAPGPFYVIGDVKAPIEPLPTSLLEKLSPEEQALVQSHVRTAPRTPRIKTAQGEGADVAGIVQNRVAADIASGKITSTWRKIREQAKSGQQPGKIPGTGLPTTRTTTTTSQPVRPPSGSAVKTAALPRPPHPETFPTKVLHLLSPAQQQQQQQQPTELPPPPRLPVIVPPPEVTTKAAGKPTVEFPLDRITLSKDVPQFKSGANEKGVVEPLAGQYERTGTPPVQLWERANGDTELISGRHRFDLAQRTGERTIPSQIHREAEGFNARAAARLDAELNIRDEKGSVGDYANYFRNSELSQADAEARGLLARGKGQAGFTIARDGSQDLFALHQSGRITDGQAAEIASAAPGNPGAQQVGIKAALEGKPAVFASNLVKAALGRAAGQPKTGDLFRFDDSAMQQMEKQATRATKIQRGLRQQIASVQGAARNPKLAARLGVDVKDPVGVQKRIGQLKSELARWQNWPMHPDLVAITHEGEFGPESELPMKSRAPSYGKSPDQLDMDLEAAADKGSTLIHSTPGQDEIQMGMNKSQIVQLLGKSMYEKPILEVTTKELLQNALDTSREAGSTAKNPKRIFMDYDGTNRTITVKDSGLGMTPETIQKAFFTIGGTKKTGSPENTSGGLGVAKMAFQLGSERIKLETVKDKLKSTVDVSSKEIAQTLEEGSKATIKILKERTDEPNGTTVTVKIPKSYVDNNGETQPIYFHNYPDFLDKPLLAPIEIVKNGETLPVGVHQKDWQKDNTFNFSWGKIHAYVKPGERTDYPKFNVLSAGLHQFDIHGGEIYGYGNENPKIPYNFALDVRPNVRGDNPSYPFNNQREGFRSTIKKDVDAMFNYFKKQAVEQQLLEARDVFKDLKQLPEIDPMKSLTKDQVEKINAASRATPQVAPYTPRKVESVDVGRDKIVTHYEGGKTEEHTREEYAKPSTFKPEREIDFEKTALDVSSLDPKKPYLHNNTSAKFDDIPGSSEFETKIGNALIKYMREVGKKVGADYADLAKTDPSGWFGGVSYDKTYRGLNTVKPFKAIWVNPGALSHYARLSPEAAAAETFYLFNHEITHVARRTEGEPFTTEEGTNSARWVAHGVPQEKFLQALKNIYAEHWDTFNQINERFQNYNTKNRAESFKSSAALGPERPEEKRLPGKRVSSFYAQGDVRFQRQGPTGAGRAGETDKQAGSLGDILRGTPADAAEEAGAANASRNSVREPVPTKETEAPRSPIGWDEALSYGRDWLAKGGDANEVVRKFHQTGKVTTEDMGKARAHLNDLQEITNRAGDEVLKRPKDQGLLKEFNDALDAEEAFNNLYRPMDAVARDTLPVLNGYAPLDPKAASSFTGLMRRFKEVRGRDPLVTEEVRAKDIAKKTREQQTEYAKSNADVYNAMDNEFKRIKSDRTGPPTFDWITKLKEVCG
jgi:thioredoxin reductase